MSRLVGKASVSCCMILLELKNDGGLNFFVSVAAYITDRWWFQTCFYFLLENGGNDSIWRAYVSNGVDTTNYYIMICFFSSDNNMIHLIHWLVFHFFHNNNNMLIMLLPCEKGGRDKSTSFWVGIFLYVKRSSGGWLGLWQHDLDGSWSKNFWTVQDWKKIATRKHDRFPPKWGFPKLGVPNNHEFSYTKNDHFGVVWGYHHLRKQPNGGEK